MVESVILENGVNKVNVDIGLTQGNKKSFTDTHFNGSEIAKCIITKISNNRCIVKLVAANSLKIEFESVLLINKVSTNIYSKACIYSHKYITRDGGMPNNEWSKSDSFPGIEVILEQF